jgi:uncharacterized protein (DUF433 family)
MDADWINHHPDIVGGKPVFRGTRVTLETVVASLADGDTPEVIMRNFPTLLPEHVQYAIALSARVALGTEKPEILRKAS